MRAIPMLGFQPQVMEKLLPGRVDWKKVKRGTKASATQEVLRLIHAAYSWNLAQSPQNLTFSSSRFSGTIRLRESAPHFFLLKNFFKMAF